MAVSCLCEGIVCRYCRRGAIRRPISNQYDETTGVVFHTAHFGWMSACKSCWERAMPTAEVSSSGDMETRTIRSPDGERGIRLTRRREDPSGAAA